MKPERTWRPSTVCFNLLACFVCLPIRFSMIPPWWCYTFLIKWIHIFTAGYVTKFKDYSLVCELVMLIWVAGVSGQGRLAMWRVTWATVFLSCRGTRVRLMIKRSQAWNFFLFYGKEGLLCVEIADYRRALKFTIPWINWRSELQRGGAI